MLRIGHRGAAGYAPENTLLSFQKALDFNVNMIEFDTYVCKSGEIVIIHDKKVNRTTNGKGNVADKTLLELKSLDAGKGEKIPTLEEALNLIARKTKVNIELKGEGTARPVYKTLKKYIETKGWSTNDFLISSSIIEELITFSNFNLGIKIGLIVTKKIIGPLGSILGIPFGFIKLAKNLKVYSIHFTKIFAKKKFISEAHKNNFKVFAWTVNKKEDIEHLKLWQIDGIISDYPDRI